MMAHITYLKVFMQRMAESEEYRAFLDRRQREEVGVADAVLALNAARDAVLARTPNLTDYSKRYLRALVGLSYPELLDAYEPAKVAASMLIYEQRAIPHLCENATSLVELKAARLLTDQVVSMLVALDAESPDVQQFIVDLHRRGRRLDVQFLAKVAGP
jgi:hypothetical protein